MSSSHEQRTTRQTDESHNTKLYLSIYIFRGEPDVYQKRHVLAYFRSADDPSFYETVHIIRHDHKSPWKVDRVHMKTEWAMNDDYLYHCDGGALLVPKGQEVVPVNIMAAIPVENREGDWNCQTFLLEGLRALATAGYQTQEWYNEVENALIDRLLDGAIG
ncbi:hypothetical protein O1611_g3240 [Lasiodiplodia mahajangana]|uniref:Uncharacterized protein n=1 Tax=Lasiodiplodia mahajangana TaxID=1108764 RepID=A0ACC2JSR7_9PEZI|nr:hypothetical protein O1611_g3240 [Lasiodiplodia mahajangana]